MTVAVRMGAGDACSEEPHSMEDAFRVISKVVPRQEEGGETRKESNWGGRFGGVDLNL